GDADPGARRDLLQRGLQALFGKYLPGGAQDRGPVALSVRPQLARGLPGAGRGIRAAPRASVHLLIVVMRRTSSGTRRGLPARVHDRAAGPNRARPAPNRTRPAPNRARPAPNRARPAPNRARPAPNRARPASRSDQCVAGSGSARGVAGLRGGDAARPGGELAGGAGQHLLGLGVADAALPPARPPRARGVGGLP